MQSVLERCFLPSYSWSSSLLSLSRFPRATPPRTPETLSVHCSRQQGFQPIESFKTVLPNPRIMKTQQDELDWRPLSVVLPVRYWITVLGILDPFISSKVGPILRDLQKKGAKPSDVPDTLKTITMGPLFARGEIVKVLTEAGVMKPEANDRHGTDALMEMAKKFWAQNN
jgi:hypothetical protein